MKLAKKILVLATVAFWALMANHCGLENVPGFKFLACSSQSETQHHEPSDCGDNDACATIESGNYKSEESQVSAAKASLTQVPFMMAVLLDLAAPKSCVSHFSPELAPPELARVWQFTFRTALLPRAPSLLS